MTPVVVLVFALVECEEGLFACVEENMFSVCADV